MRNQSVVFQPITTKESFVTIRTSMSDSACTLGHVTLQIALPCKDDLAHGTNLVFEVQVCVLVGVCDGEEGDLD